MVYYLVTYICVATAMYCNLVAIDTYNCKSNSHRRANLC